MSFIYLRVQIGLAYRNAPRLVCVENVFKMILCCSPTQCSGSHKLSTRDGGKERGEKKGPMGEEPGENFTWGGLISKRSSNQIARTFPHESSLIYLPPL
jgi:hypothetical protein